MTWAEELVIFAFAIGIATSVSIAVSGRWLGLLLNKVRGGPFVAVTRRFSYQLSSSMTDIATSLAQQRQAGLGTPHGTSQATFLDKLAWLFLYIASRLSALLWPQASRNLLHYLRNTGEALLLDLEQLLRDVPEFRVRIDEHRDELSNAAARYYKYLDTGEQMILSFASAWMGFACGEYRNLGWFLALGDWEYRLSGLLVIEPGELPLTQQRMTMLLRVSLRDYYDWDCGPITKVGPFPISNSIPARLHLTGMAREFAMYGESFALSTVNLPSVD